MNTKSFRLFVLSMIISLSFLISACGGGDIISGDTALRRDVKDITDVTCEAFGGYHDPSGNCVINR